MSRSPSRGHLLVANAPAGLDELGYRTGAFARRIDLPVVGQAGSGRRRVDDRAVRVAFGDDADGFESLQIQSICGPDEVS